jgi:hypothetical protein
MADGDISPKCKVRLEQPPDCGDAKSLRSYALCWAQWEGIKGKGMDFSTALKTGWQEARKSCAVP